VPLKITPKDNGMNLSSIALAGELLDDHPDDGWPARPQDQREPRPTESMFRVRR
jgi:hypothetical protein